MGGGGGNSGGGGWGGVVVVGMDFELQMYFYYINRGTHI